MKLIHDISGNRYIPVEGQNVLRRLPSKCPEHFPKAHRDRLLDLVRKHLSSYTQMYLDVLLRLIAPPSCCTRDQLQYLNILKEALSKEPREIVKNYLFEGYAMCAAKSSTVEEFLNIMEPRALKMIAANNDEEMKAFSDIIDSIGDFVWARDKTDILQSSTALKNFFASICDALPRLQVTSSAWVVRKQYQQCVDLQLRFLKQFLPGHYPAV